MSKTQTRTSFEITDNFKELIDKIISLPNYKKGTTLFRCYSGKPCASREVSSIWQRFMAKLIEQELISERFTFRDIRRKSATDADDAHGREYTRKLLAHSSQVMTAKYINKIGLVKPLFNILTPEDGQQ